MVFDYSDPLQFTQENVLKKNVFLSFFLPLFLSVFLSSWFQFCPDAGQKRNSCCVKSLPFTEIRLSLVFVRFPAGKQLNNLIPEVAAKDTASVKMRKIKHCFKKKKKKSAIKRQTTWLGLGKDCILPATRTWQMTRRYWHVHATGLLKLQRLIFWFSLSDCRFSCLTSAACFRAVISRLQCLMGERSTGPSQHPALCLSATPKQKPPSSCLLSASNPQSSLPIFPSFFSFLLSSFTAKTWSPPLFCVQGGRPLSHETKESCVSWQTK